MFLQLRSVLLHAALLALVVICVPVVAQQPQLQDPLLDKMIGDWVMTGTIAQKPTTHDVRAVWVLNHQFVQLHEVSREKTANGRPAYEAWVYLGWDAAQNRYVAHWIDVFGGGFSSQGHASKQESSLPFVFGAGDELFHNTMFYDAKTNTWSWNMDNEQKGQLHEFARLKLARRTK
jgi:hypothetical protein